MEVRVGEGVVGVPLDKRERKRDRRLGGMSKAHVDIVRDSAVAVSSPLIDPVPAKPLSPLASVNSDVCKLAISIHRPHDTVSRTLGSQNCH